VLRRGLGSLQPSVPQVRVCRSAKLLIVGRVVCDRGGVTERLRRRHLELLTVAGFSARQRESVQCLEDVGQPRPLVLAIATHGAIAAVIPIPPFPDSGGPPWAPRSQFPHSHGVGAHGGLEASECAAPGGGHRVRNVISGLIAGGMARNRRA
jgi:hypothetical protein